LGRAIVKSYSTETGKVLPQCRPNAKHFYQWTARPALAGWHPRPSDGISAERSEGALPPCDQFAMLPGRGVSAVVGGTEILAGNSELMVEKNIAVTETMLTETKAFLKQGCTVIYVSTDEKLAGFLVLSDTPREKSASMIDQLKRLSIKPVLLTGDNEEAATAIAGQLHIEEVHAECLPEDKLKWIGSYQEKRESVCMIGDGVNDAPALKKADIGIAMGGIGSDIAVDAADIALVDDKVEELPYLVALSKRMMTTIKLNMTFSMTLNFIAITLAITGILNPVVGALVHNAGSVFVIINSALLLNWKRNEEELSK
ncbi:MAG: HAD-IC family P-type ATPase, partial [Clostridiales bacterium]|nr:HAD-IC family P-type ATPase [Clostridiales bacterium]